MHLQHASMAQSQLGLLAEIGGAVDVLLIPTPALTRQQHSVWVLFRLVPYAWLPQAQLPPLDRRQAIQGPIPAPTTARRQAPSAPPLDGQGTPISPRWHHPPPCRLHVHSLPRGGSSTSLVFPESCRHLVHLACRIIAALALTPQPVVLEEGGDGRGAVDVLDRLGHAPTDSQPVIAQEGAFRGSGWTRISGGVSEAHKLTRLFGPCG
mmetsp:Transcript_41045/g.102544  ORF Transcript_41045/g.102544 Transcript_41045/m.102544 type:complete len:208 (-) Transcript_41045:318-941(-)